MAIACGGFFAESGITLALLLVYLALSWNVWLPYLYGAVILATGLNSLRLAGKQGYGIVSLAPLFIAVPIAVFGTDHFTATQIVAAMVQPTQSKT